ncbi:MAG: PKD domain-containing protein [Euryarchaeota archaeon]|nr:PKD domain-containing protein [Euryarchaeota archaeon]
MAGVNVTFDASSSTGSNVSFAWDMGDNTTYGEIPAAPGEVTADNSTDNSTGGNETVLVRLPFLSLGFQPNETNATANGTEAPAELPENAVIEHAYAEAGEYNVTLYVTDDAGQTTTAAVLVSVSPSGPASGTWLRTDQKQWSGAASNIVATASPCATASNAWEFVDQEANGTASVVSKILITATYGSTTGVNNNLNLYLLGPDGKEIKSHVGGTGAKKIELDGAFAAGKYTVKVERCTTGAGVQVTYAATGQATYTIP